MPSSTPLLILVYYADHLLLQPFPILSFLDEYEFIIAPIIFTALAFFTRMWKIGLSPIVTWDEAQYGVMSCFYRLLRLLTPL